MPSPGPENLPPSTEPVPGIPPVRGTAPEANPAPIEAPPTATAATEKPPAPESGRRKSPEEAQREKNIADARSGGVLKLLQTFKDLREGLRPADAEAAKRQSPEDKEKVKSLPKIDEAILAVRPIRKSEKKDIGKGLEIVTDIITDRIKELVLHRREIKRAREDEAIVGFIRSTVEAAKSRKYKKDLITDQSELALFETYLGEIAGKIGDSQKPLTQEDDRREAEVGTLREEVQRLSGYVSKKEAEKIADRENVIPSTGEKREGEPATETAIAGDTGEHPKPPETAPEPEENPIEVFKRWKEDKKRIEAELAGNPDATTKEGLLAEREITAGATIKQGCAILGKDFNEEKKEWKRREEEEWQRSLELWLRDIPRNGKTLQETHIDWERGTLAANKKTLEAHYDGIIKDSFMPKKWQENLLAGGEITIGKGLRTINISKEDAAMCIDAKLDLGKVKRSVWGQLGLSNRFWIGGREFADVNALNDFIGHQRGIYLQRAAEERAEQRKQLTIERFIRQPVLDGRAMAINNEIVDKLKAEQEQRRIQKSKEREEAKIAEAERLIPEQRFDLVNEMDMYFGKIKATYKAWEKIKSGKLAGAVKVPGPDGKMRKLTEAQSSNELAKLLHEYSDDVVRIAEELTGENVKRDALIAAGFEDRLPETPEEKRRFREKLTENIRAIFKEQLKKVNEGMKASGKKVARKSKKVLAAPKAGEIEPTSPGDLWEGVGPT